MKKIILLLSFLIISSFLQFYVLLKNALGSDYKELLYSQSILNKEVTLMLDDSKRKTNIFNLNQALDPYIFSQWGLKNDGTFIDEYGIQSTHDVDINVIKAWYKYTGKKEVIIAIIDTGIDYSHEDLKDVIWTNSGEIAGDGIDNDNNGYIDDIYGWNFYDNSNVTYNSKSNEDDHGTHVAGIIAASRNNIGIAGVASNSNIKIMTLKTLGSGNHSGSIKSFIKAIEYAENMGASICNISSGTYIESTKLKSEIDNSNMLFIAAAGNGEENNDVFPTYPASFDSENIISVANINCNGTLNVSSNYGKKSVDIAAPGTSILSTFTNNHYGYLSGTSMAAPIVTGVVAMVYSYFDDITLLEAKEIVLDSAKKISALEGKVVTGGIPDAFASISYSKKK